MGENEEHKKKKNMKSKERQLGSALCTSCPVRRFLSSLNWKEILDWTRNQTYFFEVLQPRSKNEKKIV